MDYGNLIIFSECIIHALQVYDSTFGVNLGRLWRFNNFSEFCKQSVCFDGVLFYV